MAIISVEIFSVVLAVVSISHIFSLFCLCRASTRQTSRISAARFSQSLGPE